MKLVENGKSLSAFGFWVQNKKRMWEFPSSKNSIQILTGMKVNSRYLTTATLPSLADSQRTLILASSLSALATDINKSDNTFILCTRKDHIWTTGQIVDKQIKRFFTTMLFKWTSAQIHKHLKDNIADFHNSPMK